MTDRQREGRLSSGIPGLDEILHGGFPAGRIYLAHGEAGTGKTTIGLHFLMAGVAAGRRCVCITLLQTLSELPLAIRDAATVGQSVFNTADVELSEVTDAIEEPIREHRPECLAVLKERYGDHECSIRELKLGADGVTVGEPLSSFSGLLTGNPRFEGTSSGLFSPDD